jgi:riboflavin kinase / FMN adenylyltransferase
LRVTWGLERAEFNPRTITTLGTYDGVHLGHRKLLSHMVQRKKELGYERTVVLTFHPHPQEVLRKNNTTIELLTTIEERIALLETTGIDEVVVIEFTKEFAATSYIDFFRDTIVKSLGTKTMIVGFNHAFGKNREGDAEHLKTLAPELGVTIEEVGPLEIDDVSLSSTKIRGALKDGLLEIANKFLGRPYEFTGVVEGGDKLGRELGYPTANLRLPANKLIPSDGVYAVECGYENKLYQGAMSIGTKPTITDSAERYVEVFLFDFDEQIYDRSLRVLCHKYLRPQRAFPNLDELKHQIAKDVEDCKQVLAVG